MGSLRARVPIAVWEHDVERLGHPGQLVWRYGPGLNCERPIPARVLTDETIGLQPTRQRRLGDVRGGNLVLSVGVAAMPLDHVTRQQSSCRNESTGGFATAPPHQMVSRHVERIARLGV